MARRSTRGAAVSDSKRRCSTRSRRQPTPPSTDSSTISKTPTTTDWPKVIERARKGAEHPLEVLDYSGKTEDHPVCSAVLSFVGSGKKGKDVRAHFSDPPHGWSRDAVDAALISLLGTGHLRATTNGTPLKPGQLDQAKISGTDFRVESATINTRQRLKIRKLITTVGVACKPNEEVAAAGEFIADVERLGAPRRRRCAAPRAPGHEITCWISSHSPATSS